MMMDLHNQDFLERQDQKITASQLVRYIVLLSLLTLPLLVYSHTNKMIFETQKNINELQKSISAEKKTVTALQLEYTRLLSPQHIESNALAMGFTSFNSEGILVIDDSAPRQSPALFADLRETNGEWME